MNLKIKFCRSLDAIPALAWSARPDGSADFFNLRWRITPVSLLNKHWIGAGRLQFTRTTSPHPGDLRERPQFQSAIRSGGSLSSHRLANFGGSSFAAVRYVTSREESSNGTERTPTSKTASAQKMPSGRTNRNCV